MKEEVKEPKKNPKKKPASATKKKTTTNKKKTSTKSVATSKKASVKKTASSKPTKAPSKKTTPVKKVEEPKFVEIIEEDEKFIEIREENKVVEETKEPKKNSTKNKIRNEKLVLIIIGLIIALLIFGIVYITTTHHKQEERIAKYVNESRQAGKNNTSGTESGEVVSGTMSYKNIQEITYSKFQEVLKEEEQFILLITKRQCPACTRLQPILNSYLEEQEMTAYSIEVTKLTDDDKKTLGDKYDLQSTPTTIIIKDKEAKAQVEGEINKENLQKWIEENY